MIGLGSDKNRNKATNAEFIFVEWGRVGESVESALSALAAIFFGS